MFPRVVAKCRRIFYLENKFFPKESIIAIYDFNVNEIVNWFRDNILYYEKRDTLERKSVPFVSEELFKMLFIARLTLMSDDNNVSRITVEINDECLYISGAKESINYPSVFFSAQFLKIWKMNRFPIIDFVEIYNEEKLNRRISIIHNSVYFNFKSRTKNSKYFQKGSYKFSDKELVIADALELFSTSLEVANYTRIPQRTVRYYLDKLRSYGIVDVQGKTNSPERKYRLTENSAKILGK